MTQVHVFTLDDVRRNAGTSPWMANPDDPIYTCRILAEGDSWFSIGAIPSSNVLNALNLSKSAIVINLAKPGDRLMAMADLAKNPDLATMMSTTQFGWKWNVILMSGGGNDLIGASDSMIHAAATPGDSNPEAYVNRGALNGLLETVANNYRKIVALRDSGINKDTPIVVHTYDYVTPSHAGARFITSTVAGPWFEPVMEQAGVPVAVRNGVSDILMGALAECILALAQGPNALPHFYPVNTMGTLTRAATGATGNSNDWLNEIHPNAGGYSKIAAKLASQINALI